MQPHRALNEAGMLRDLKEHACLGYLSEGDGATTLGVLPTTLRQPVRLGARWQRRQRDKATLPPMTLQWAPNWSSARASKEPEAASDEVIVVILMVALLLFVLTGVPA